MSDWKDTADGIASIAQALALLVGGLWAYFKFIRGRTFARRAEVTLGASLVTSGGAKIMKVAVTLQNTGVSKIVLDPGFSVLYLYAAAAADVRPTENIDWGQHVTVTPILADHGWIEAQEVITEDVLIPLRADDTSEHAVPLACKIVCKVLAKRVFWRRDLQWTANAVVEVGDEEGINRAAAERR